MPTIISINFNETSYADATSQIQIWARGSQSRAVYATSAHGTVEAHDSREFRDILNRADLITPDGMPVVWLLRLKGLRNQQRVYGPTLMLYVIEMATREKIPVGFYGGKPDVLKMLVARLKQEFPLLEIKYAFSPPFHELDEEETKQIRKEILQSRVQILFVGLGCPRQEKWIDAQRGFIPAVMIGVGAAFDFHAGVKAQAPGWVQKIGLEWFYRLITEPRRLWRRYLSIVPRFIAYAMADFFTFLRKPD